MKYPVRLLEPGIWCMGAPPNCVYWMTDAFEHDKLWLYMHHEVKEPGVLVRDHLEALALAETLMDKHCGGGG